jgi:hypothetical protein
MSVVDTCSGGQWIQHVEVKEQIDQRIRENRRISIDGLIS